MEPNDRSESLGNLLAETFGWGVVCALATAAAGLFGHQFGAQLYRQPYEQIPSDFFFVPLGLLVGFIAAGMGRLAGRGWSGAVMALFIAMVAVVYGGALFQYSRNRAVGPRLSASIEPESLDAHACTPDKCEPADPPCQWYVEGSLRIKETSGLGAAIERIEISSNGWSTGREKPQPYSKERAAEASRWRGPDIVLTGRHIPGPRRLTQDGESVYPFVYAYHTQDGASRRIISISVYLKDGAGRSAYTGQTIRVY